PLTARGSHLLHHINLQVVFKCAVLEHNLKVDELRNALGLWPSNWQLAAGNWQLTAVNSATCPITGSS
ncbi:MAG: hypothetical protein ABI882_06035, partial [Acidobacteriota bacterium]